MPTVVIVWKPAWEGGNLPSCDEAIKIIYELYDFIQPIYDTPEEKCLKIEFVNGSNSDLYGVAYPNSIYYARQVKNALEIITKKPVYIETL